MELELNRNYEISKNDYSYIEVHHKRLLRKHIEQNVEVKFPWADPHLKKIFVKEE